MLRVTNVTLKNVGWVIVAAIQLGTIPTCKNSNRLIVSKVRPHTAMKLSRFVPRYGALEVILFVKVVFEISF